MAGSKRKVRLITLITIDENMDKRGKFRNLSVAVAVSILNGECIEILWQKIKVSRWVKWGIIIRSRRGHRGSGGIWYFQARARTMRRQYQTVPVTRGDLTQAVTATGTLNPVTNVTVGCQVSGRISKLYVDFNSPVTNGQLIAEIDPRTYQAAVEQASADLANAKANLELQQVEAHRSERIVHQQADFRCPITTRPSPICTKPRRW